MNGLLLLALGGLGVWAFTRSRENGCVVTQAKLSAWGAGQHYAVLFASDRDTPPPLPEVQAALEWALIDEGIIGWLIVTRDGTFWLYESNGVPYPSAQLKRSYCESFG